MKKQFLLATTILFVGGSALLTSCKKDETAPVITLTGGKEVSFDLAAAAEPGVTADDEKDGDVTAAVTSDWATAVKKNEVGTYTVTYKVSDEAANEATETRTVKVKSDKLAGSYSVTDIVSGGSFPGTYNYTVTITQSSTDYNKVLIGNFLGLGTSVSGSATVSGTTLTIPAQAIATSGGTFNVSGSGQYDGAAFKITKLTYTGDNGLGNGDATLVKQ
jgi:hypothetical protein